MTANRVLPYRPVGLLVRAVVVGLGLVLAIRGAAATRDAVYVLGLLVVALGVLSLVSAESRRPAGLVRVAALVVAVAVVVVGVWVPRSAAQAAATAGRSFAVGDLTFFEGRPSLTSLPGDRVLLTDGSSVQRLDPDAGRAGDLFPFSGRARLADGEALVEARLSEVQAISLTGETLWRRPTDPAFEEDPTPVAAADGVVVIETCDSYDDEDGWPACRRTGVDRDGEVVFTVDGFDQRPTELATPAGAGAFAPLPGVFVSRPGARSDDVEIRAAADGRLLETVRRQDPRPATPVVVGDTVVLSSGPDGACTLTAHRDGRATWSVPDPYCTPTLRAIGGADEQPAVTGDRLWLPRYDDRTLTLDLRDGTGRLTATGLRDDSSGDLSRTPDLTAWTQDAEVRLVGRTLGATDPATGEERWRRTLPRRALRWWVRGETVTVRAAAERPLLLDPDDTEEQLTVYDTRTGRVRGTLRLPSDDRDERDALVLPYDEGVLRVAPEDPDDDGPWRAEVLGDRAG